MTWSSSRPILLVICAADAVYVEKLTQLLGETESGFFRTEGFSDPERLLSYFSSHYAQILLLEEALASQALMERLSAVFDGTTVLLCEESGVSGSGVGGQPARISRYQRTDVLAGSLRSLLGLGSPSRPALSKERGASHLTAVYSPAGRSGKTAFSLTLGRVLAGQGKQVLYLNLEEYPVLPDQDSLAGLPDLSDVIFSLRKASSGGAAGETFSPEQAVCSWQDIRTIPPPPTPSDLRDIAAEEWISLLETLSTAGMYDEIILDMGAQLQDPFAILTACDLICIPVLDDPVAAAKLARFKNCLKLLDYTSLESKLHFLYLPPAGPLPEFSSSGTGRSLSEYVRSFLASLEEDETQRLSRGDTFRRRMQAPA